MPIIRDIPFKLTYKEVLRWEGIRDYSTVTRELKTQILELLTSVKKTHLLEPAVAYETYSIMEITHDQIFLGDNKVICSPLLSSLLFKAKELAISVCTIGLKLEKQTAYYFEHNETLRGVILDGIGSAAVTSLDREAYNLITAEASSYGYHAGSPIRPGVNLCRLGLPITEQWQLFKLIPVNEIGVSLTSTGIMVPLKSASMIIGIGPEVTEQAQAGSCANCSIRQTCAYRV